MKLNMGMIDRILRTIVAIVILVLYFTGQITGWALLVLGIVAIIFLITGAVGFCPLYTLIGLSTKKK